MNADDEYRRDVLEPARAAGDQPPGDLRVRYRLAEPLDAAAVTAAVKEVRQVWRRARGQLKYRRLVDRLEAEHRELAGVFTAAERGDLRPLAERLRGGRERDERRRGQARARLVDAAGLLRAVTPGEIDGIARAAGIAAAELTDLARQDRIEIRAPDRLPGAAPYAAYPKVRESLDVLGKRHLADFVFGDRLTGPLRVLDDVTAPGVTLGADAVEATAAEWARRSRDTSTTHAATVLACLRSDAPLPDLLRYDVVDRVRERARQRASERGLLRFVQEELRIDQHDAYRLVFAVLRESAPGGGSAGRLRALLDAGDVHAAAELAAAAWDAEEPPEDVAVLAAEARQRVTTARALRDEAARESDPDRAWRLLADALRLVRDLPGAAEHQRRLAPAPVPALRADADSGPGGVTLTWEPSPSTAGEITYAVVRRQGRPPRGPADGKVLPGGHDDRPPINVPLFYAVVAQRGDAAAPPAVAGPVVVRPEPRDVTLTAGDGTVAGRWRIPREAARVLVERDGVPIPATRDWFRDAVPNETTRHYRIAAVYLGEDGGETVTRGVTVSATPTAPPQPVYEIDAAADPADPGLLRVRFAPPQHGTVEFVLTESPPPWPRSAQVPAEEVWREARRLPSRPSPGGVAVRPGGGGWVVAVSVAGATAAIGAHHRYVNLPPPRRLVADRRGGQVHLGFDWPDGVPEVVVGYRIGAGRAVERSVTRAYYDTQGGLRLAVPPEEPVEVTVAAAGASGGARVLGPAAATRIPSRTVVAYDLERGGPPWNRTLTIHLTAARPVTLARLALVLRTGKVQPYSAGDGETVGAWHDVAAPGAVTLPLPKATGPYWLRCFAEDDVIELGDPPVRSLRSGR
ncbi:hypothetical protein [Actinomadura flavalba]|uniref:hypothetical protein n=1 Tax=Actinomadura flavalba TaxID=1120938 RepID=UPI00039D0534|nr:hypothetical protein [Actinomadura flavalba]